VKIKHRVPVGSWWDAPVSDEVDEDYAARVAADTAGGEEKHRIAQEKLRRAEKALERQQHLLSLGPGRAARKKKENLVRQLQEQVNQRRLELEEFERLMLTWSSPRRARHRVGLDDHLEMGVPASKPAKGIFASPIVIYSKPEVLAPPVPPLAPPPIMPLLGERRTRQSIPQAVKVAVSARDQGRCQCTAYPCHGGSSVCWSTEEPQFDHIIPWSQNGADTVANVVVKCGPCNRRKGARYVG
jgi:hypothetical protein